MSEGARTRPSVRRVGPEAAEEVLGVVRAAFADRPKLDPPTDAHAESVETMAERLAGGGGLLAELDGRPVGAVVLDPHGEMVYLRRFGVAPEAQGRGVARTLVVAALQEAATTGADRAVVLAREELPATVGFWRDMGFTETGRRPPYVELARPLLHRYDAPTAEAMRDLGRALAAGLRAGDVLVLSGELGAGKTTFAQGLGEGLGVRGDVTSPTFVISRVHPSLGDGPDLVHVDAYRLGGMAELDDLDLDADLDRSVTIVEWGEGLAEPLSDSPLEVRILREIAAPEADPEDDPRVVEVAPLGRRWLADPLPVLVSRSAR